jgi:CubicO group peptidase (beta-lactamase class C family)
MRYWCVLLAVSAYAADDGRIRTLMEAGEVPGMAAAVVRDGRVVWEGAYGVMRSGSPTRVNAQTIFQAASLTKPVFAYGVMKLVEAGKLDLDAPLAKWLPDYLPKDELSQKITARQVLSHSSGLPNWRRADRELKSHFPPGERFSYSGEGYVFLSRVVEKITGQGLEEFMKTAVFEPLGMKDSSLVWQPAYESRMAAGHDGGGRPQPLMRGNTPNAAASLLTTAGDFARFMAAAVEGRGLSAETKTLMFRAHTPVRFMCGECLAPDRKPWVGDMAWALGWGLDRDDGRDDYFQWGDNGIYKALVVASPKRRDGVVLFMNSVSGLSIAEDLVQELLGRPTAVTRWLSYERHDSARRQLTKSIANDGLTETHRAAIAMLDAGDRLAVAGALHERGRMREALEIGEKAVGEAPSAQAHFRLADAYLLTGNFENAGRHYRAAVKLAPDNKYFASMAELVESGGMARASAGGNMTFRLKGHPAAREVFVAGTFNNGHRRQLPLQRNDDGVWQVRAQVKPGKHTYLFYVDGEAVLDPDNPQQEQVGERKQSFVVVE